MLILGLQGSPRKGGNSDTFMAAFMDRAARAGATVRTIQAARSGVVPCKGCGYCEKHGTCVIIDDPMSTEVFGLIRKADLIVAASPVYFYGVSAQLKVLIDRCQTLWSRKYIFRLQDPLAATRKGLLFSVAASQGRQLFDGVRLTANYFFDAINASPTVSLTYRGIEAKGAISRHAPLVADVDAAIQTAVLPLVTRKKVLFVSSQGACRAPMAAAMAQQRYSDRIRTDFAGRSPAADLKAPMLRAMTKNGVDLSYRQPKPVDQAFFGARPDLVICLDAADAAISDQGLKTIRWTLAETAPSDDDGMDRLRQDIQAHTDQLMPLLKNP
jgi:multimeric flavodoxin WrbA/protein-tyrosine-phosphatase